MMSFYALSATLRGKLLRIVAAILLLFAGISATQASAGDLSAQPRDSLGVVGSSTGALPQAGGGVAAETGWLSRFHVTGYLSEQFGFWQNPTALRSFTRSRNNLAVARTTFQVDENFQLDENNSFFMREWFTYDPPYSWNSANNRLYSRTSSCKSLPPGKCFPLAPDGGMSVGPHSYGHFTNDALNQYNVRDAWWQNKWGPLTTFVGNQIVVWGQSLSFRVGDIVNPNDTAWAFGFANLEQSRKPQWMVHPILNLPDFGPLSSNFLEVVWSPGWNPQYTECDYADQRYDGYQTKCGRNVTGQPALSSAPLMRFESMTPQKIYRLGVFEDPLKGAPLGAKLGVNGPFDLGQSNGAYPTGVGNNNLVAGDGFFELSHCSSGPFNEKLLFGDVPGVVNVYNQVPIGLRKPCVRLSKGFNTAGALGDRALTDFGRFRIRGYSPQFWNEGVRYHTLISDTELTAFVYYDNTNQGTEANAKWVPYTNLFEYDTAAEVLGGLTANRPVPLPETIAEHFPVVAKAEAVYINHKSFDDRRPYVLTTRRFSDVVNWLAALDVTNAYAPWLSSTGDLSANLEVFDSIAMDIAKDMDASDRTAVHILKNPIQILFNAGSSWYYGDIAAAWTMIYGVKGNTFLMFPSVTLNPPWTKKYFIRLFTIQVLGGDRQAAQVQGTFKGQSFVSALLQYNFQLR